MAIPELVDFSAVGASAGIAIGAIVCGLIGVCILLSIIRSAVALVSSMVSGDVSEVAVEGVSSRVVYSEDTGDGGNVHYMEDGRAYFVANDGSYHEFGEEDFYN